MKRDRMAVGIGGGDEAAERAIGRRAEYRPAPSGDQAVQRIGVGARKRRPDRARPHPEHCRVIMTKFGASSREAVDAGAQPADAVRKTMLSRQSSGEATTLCD